MKLHSVSVVIVSEGNNPRLLNPDFLSRNGIVPQNWEPQDTLVLPPIARVQYKNGIEVTLEEQKLTIRSNDPEASDPEKIDWAAELPRIALSIMTTLPHVAYLSVGLNFDIRIPIDADRSKSSLLPDAMIKDGPWLEFGDDRNVTGVKMAYRFTDTALNLVIDKVSVSDEDGPKEDQIRYDLNFHRDLKSAEKDDREAFINLLPKRHDQANELVNQFCGISK